MTSGVLGDEGPRGLPPARIPVGMPIHQVCASPCLTRPPCPLSFILSCISFYHLHQLLHNFIYREPTLAANFTSVAGAVDMLRFLCSRDATIAQVGLCVCVLCG